MGRNDLDNLATVASGLPTYSTSTFQGPDLSLQDYGHYSQTDNAHDTSRYLSAGYGGMDGLPESSPYGRTGGHLPMWILHNSRSRKRAEIITLRRGASALSERDSIRSTLPLLGDEPTSPLQHASNLLHDVNADAQLNYKDLEHISDIHNRNGAMSTPPPDGRQRALKFRWLQFFDRLVVRLHGLSSPGSYQLI